MDEGVYHMMARSFSAGGDLHVWNGYEEFPSPELVLPALRVHEGQLIPSYPYLSTLLAAPFYLLVGYKGLYVLNAFAFLGVVCLTLMLGRTLFRDADLALNAGLILILGTFAWEYSQAAWPHALSMLFATGALYAAVTALQTADPRKSVALAAAAGLVAGFGTGVRLDVIFVLPALLLPLTFVTPWRPRLILATCIATVPGLAVLAATNYVKFGTANPFSYGVSGPGNASVIASYLPILFLGSVVAVALWTATRPSVRTWVASHRLECALGGTLLLVTLALTPTGWQMVSRLANGTYQLLFDFRIRGLEIREMELSRSAGGGMVYFGSLKKALLQSCPYLVVMVLPLAQLLSGRRDTLALGVACLVPATYIGVYAFFAWHGGMVLNLRYFLPIFPFTSLLTAYAWRELTEDLPAAWHRAAIFAGLGTSALYLLFVASRDLPLEQQEGVILSFPMALALVVLALALGSALTRGQGRVRLRGATLLALSVSLIWAAMVAFTYDLPRAYQLRSERAELSNTIAGLIEPDSVIFATSGDWYYGLLSHQRVRIAVPTYDDYRDFQPLARFHLEASRPVYVWLDPVMERAVGRRRLLKPFAKVILFENHLGSLIQLRRRSRAAQPTPAS
ncbi:MAG: hypothetical protein OEM93_14120 [Rhodospirillales bacterium]|nr:hypothetical protein [Rhodospirillales bacterium]